MSSIVVVVAVVRLVTFVVAFVLRRASVDAEGWEFWTEQRIEDAPGIAEWHFGLQNDFADSQPFGFVDYLILAAARCYLNHDGHQCTM